MQGYISTDKSVQSKLNSRHLYIVFKGTESLKRVCKRNNSPGSGLDSKFLSNFILFTGNVVGLHVIQLSVLHVPKTTHKMQYYVSLDDIFLFIDRWLAECLLPCS